jgi:NADH dehydrogenase
VAELEAVLDASPAAWGWVDQCWTLARIADVARRRFGVDYTLAGLDLLLHRIGWSVQIPARRAAERDEAAITTWREETWPVVKGRRRRGVQVRTGQSVAEALEGHVQLSTGEKVPTRSLIWCVGVRAVPLMDGLDLDTNRGRPVVDEFMSVPGAPGVYACGDCAAVPDLTRPGQVCGMTAQHAQRQGKQVARNVAASLGTGKARPYQHRDEGFLVDLGGLAAAANPLNVPLSGPAANAVTRGYHLYAMSGNRLRVLADWVLNAATPPEVTSFGVISSESVPLDPDKPRALTQP